MGLQWKGFPSGRVSRRSVGGRTHLQSVPLTNAPYTTLTRGVGGISDSDRNRADSIGRKIIDSCFSIGGIKDLPATEMCSVADIAPSGTAKILVKGFML